MLDILHAKKSNVVIFASLYTKMDCLYLKQWHVWYSTDLHFPLPLLYLPGDKSSCKRVEQSTLKKRLPSHRAQHILDLKGKDASCCFA